MFRRAVLSHQEALLKQDLGGRYQRKRIEAGFACPTVLTGAWPAFAATNGVLLLTMAHNELSSNRLRDISL